MEIVLPMTAGLAMFAGSFALLGGEGGDVRRSGGRAVRLLALRASRGLRALARTRLVSWVLSTELGERMVREAARSTPGATALPAEEAAAALLMVATVLALVFDVLFLTPLAGLVAIAALCFLLAARDSSRRERERRDVLAEMPGVYRTLSVAMGSGQTLAQAVEYVGVHERGPAAAVFTRMSLRLRCGVPTEDAVSMLADELEVPGARLLAAALVISHRTGSPLRDLLLRSARLAERQGEFERLLVVKTAQVRLSVRIVCLLPVAMIGVLTLISPDFQRGLLTPSGMGCVLVAMMLDGTALVLIRRLMRGVM